MINTPYKSKTNTTFDVTRSVAKLYYFNKKNEPKYCLTFVCHQKYSAIKLSNFQMIADMSDCYARHVAACLGGAGVPTLRVP